MLNKIRYRLEMSREVKRAFAIAREGVDGFHDEAEVAALIVARAIEDKDRGYSSYCKEAHVKSARYRVHLKAAYPKASELAIEQAALDIAWVDSHTVPPDMHDQNLKNARKSIERIIKENGDAYPLFEMRR